jgi:hypothetical protein
VSGGAIYLEKPGGESSISESIFTANNVSADANGHGGGAVYNASTGGTLEINRTAFNANFSTQGAGGAIVNKISASTFISNTLFDANIAGDSTHARNGGGIYNQGPLSIVKSTFVLNVAEGGSGGGLMPNRTPRYDRQLNFAPRDIRWRAVARPPAFAI